MTVLAIGDSRTILPGAWPSYASGGEYSVVGQGSATIAILESVLDSELDDLGDITVGNYCDFDYALFNIGAKDAEGSLDTQVNTEADLASMAAMINSRWPSTEVYFMRPWCIGCDTNADTLAGWIANVVATQSWINSGPDERVFLENGDNGATYMADNLHPNAAGYALTADEWETLLGIP